jgi:alpha-amylase
MQAFKGEVRLYTPINFRPILIAFRLRQAAFFDVPLHMNLNHASTQRSRYDLRKILQDTIVQAKPNDAVTFVDNHE